VDDFFEVFELAGGKVVIEDDDVRVVFAGEFVEFLGLTGSDKSGRIKGDAVLHDACNHLGPGGLGEAGEFPEGVARIGGGIGEEDRDEDGLFGVDRQFGTGFKRQNSGPFEIREWEDYTRGRVLCIMAQDLENIETRKGGTIRKHEDTKPAKATESGDKKAQDCDTGATGTGVGQTQGTGMIHVWESAYGGESERGEAEVLMPPDKLRDYSELTHRSFFDNVRRNEL
jgi:hypothetical protein